MYVLYFNGWGWLFIKEEDFGESCMIVCGCGWNLKHLPSALLYYSILNKLLVPAKQFLFETLNLIIMPVTLGQNTWAIVLDRNLNKQMVLTVCVVIGKNCCFSVDWRSVIFRTEQFKTWTFYKTGWVTYDLLNPPRMCSMD